MNARNSISLAVVCLTLIGAGTGTAAAASGRTLFVAPGGSDGVGCSANSSVAPFASVQRAVACSTDGDVISLAPSGSAPYAGIGAVSDNVRIEAAAGASARTVTIDAGQGPLSVAAGANVILSGVTLTCPGNDCAAPSVTNQGDLTLSGDAVSANQSLESAVLNTTPAGSSTSASLTVQGSTLSGNIGHGGGAIQSQPGTGATGAVVLSVANSTIVGNSALTSGGGVGVFGTTSNSSATITNSTITNNSAQSAGGGIYASGTVALSNTVLAANTSRTSTSPDCIVQNLGQLGDGPGGHNLIGNGTGCPSLTDRTNGDQVGIAASPIAPGLGALAFNGGTTETEPAVAGSPVIGTGSAATCETPAVMNLDQRRVSRNAAARDVCDIGADDTGGATPVSTAPTITAPASANATVSSPFSVKVTASGKPIAALAESGNLPAGVSFIDNGNGTAALAGTPAAGSAGRYPITLTAMNGVSPIATHSFTLTVADLSASAVAPSSIAQGAHALAVTLTGTGFKSSATLAASSSGITFSSVTVKSPTTITAIETAAADVTTGPYDLTISEPGTSATCTGCVSVLSPPTIAGLTPATLGQGAKQALVTINGSGFVAPAKVSITGPGSGLTGTVTSLTPTTLAVKVSVPATAPTGTYSLSVTVADGGVASCSGCLTVITGPAINSISPANVARGETTALTLTGSGFSPDLKLTGPKGVKFSSITVSPDGTTITATITVAATAQTGSGLAVTVQNGSLGSYGSATYDGLNIT